MVPEVVAQLPWTALFKITREYPSKVEIVDDSHGRDQSSACDKAFAEVVAACQEQNLFNQRQEHEMYRVLGTEYPVRIFRYACPLFGIVAQGAHMTAYTRTSDGGGKIWVPRRSLAAGMTYPGMLNSTVAGGVKAEWTPFETIVQESQEEASLTEHLVRRNVRPAGCLTFMGLFKSPVRNGGEKATSMLKPELLHVYDLELPGDVVLGPNDSEVKEFYITEVEEVKARLLRVEFKTNSAAVMVDFLVRHGFIREEEEPNYAEITVRLHRRLGLSTAPRL
jgi:hypothetical protein